MQSKPASSLRAVGTLHGMWSSSAGRCVSRSDAWMNSSARVSAIVSTYFLPKGLCDHDQHWGQKKRVVHWPPSKDATD